MGVITIFEMYILAVLAACLALGSATVWKDCGSKTGVVKNVVIPGCDGMPCILKRGSEATIKIDFVANGVTNKVTASVHGILGPVPVPFPIPQSDGCKSGVACPTTAGTEYSYSAQIAVQKMYPKVKVIVKWELQDDNGADLACVTIPAEIQD